MPNNLHSEETGFVAYYNNEGKGRPCVNLPLIFSLDMPCTIRVFTDEVYGLDHRR